eukprot:TRINITY_DN796_c0_g1_i4.p3 TRINITY_DN796_c0_g1~~TRINITY_DN796_c0_g1_i4.p3  ORF type:complete len:108 (-),score=10.10 TRINITY_DN796_c0_g1_i4:481-804(-)
MISISFPLSYQMTTTLRTFRQTPTLPPADTVFNTKRSCDYHLIKSLQLLHDVSVCSAFPTAAIHQELIVKTSPVVLELCMSFLSSGGVLTIRELSWTDGSPLGLVAT